MPAPLRRGEICAGGREKLETRKLGSAMSSLCPCLSQSLGPGGWRGFLGLPPVSGPSFLSSSACSWLTKVHIRGVLCGGNGNGKVRVEVCPRDLPLCILEPFLPQWEWRLDPLPSFRCVLWKGADLREPGVNHGKWFCFL